MKKPVQPFIFFSIIFFIASAFPATGHPHIFVEPAVTVTTNGDGRIGFNIVWTWDPGWSYRIISSCDKNGDGIFSPAEKDLVYQNFFTDFEIFHYFTTIFIDGRKIDINGIENFIARTSREQIVTFIFFIPAGNENTVRGCDIRIVMNDDAFTVGFLQELDVRSNGPVKAFGIDLKMIKPFGVQAEFTLSGDL